MAAAEIDPSGYSLLEVYRYDTNGRLTGLEERRRARDERFVESVTTYTPGYSDDGKLLSLDAHARWEGQEEAFRVWSR